MHNTDKTLIKCNNNSFYSHKSELKYTDKKHKRFPITDILWSNLNVLRTIYNNIYTYIKHDKVPASVSTWTYPGTLNMLVDLQKHEKIHRREINIHKNNELVFQNLCRITYISGTC